MITPPDNPERGPMPNLISGWKSLNPGFRIHAIAFVAVMLILGAFDWWTAEPYWAHWVFLGWGAGLCFHGYLVWRRDHKPGAT